MSVNELMSKAIIALDLDDDLSKAKTIFDEHKIHHIIIKENKKLVGIVTDRDLYQHLSPSIGTRKETYQDTALLQKKLNLIMSKELITAKASISLNEAAVLFHQHHISCLPIVDDNFHPIGIITWRDIIKVIALLYKKKIRQNE